MANDIITVESRHVDSVKVNEQSMAALGERIALMKKFVKDQLRNHIDGDYARIPGTPKPTLLKPGAEKLLLLFNLGFSFEVISSVIDFHINEVSFLIRCKVFKKNEPDSSIGEYIAYCSNQEKKYKNQNAADIVNTILKMAEKRALVGATLSATGASDYFSQDLEDMDKTKTNIDSKRFAKEGSDLAEFQVSFGKFKGKTLGQLTSDDIENYVGYIVEKASKDNKELEGVVLEFVNKARDYLKARAG